MKSEERASVNNGIWMCYRHGKLIDTDEVRFTISMLKRWKHIAELRARIEQESGRTVDLDGLIDTQLTLAPASASLSSVGAENELIGCAIQDSCLPVLWGSEIAHAIRDLAIELARNAMLHGQASRFELRIQEKQLTIIDDGLPYDPFALLTEERESGGVQAMKYMVEKLSHRVLITSRRTENNNELLVALVRSADDIRELSPCAIEFSYGAIDHEPRAFNALVNCNTIYVLAGSFLAVSDAIRLVRQFRRDLGSKRLVFVVDEVSSLVETILRDAAPDATLMKLP